MWIPKIKTSNHYWLNVDSFENIIVTHEPKLFPLGFGWNFKKKTPPPGFLREASPDSPDNKLKVKYS